MFARGYVRNPFHLQVLRTTTKVGFNTTLEFLVDSELGNYTQVTISSEKSVPPVELLDPSGVLSETFERVSADYLIRNIPSPAMVSGLLDHLCVIVSLNPATSK